jgi:hypothetical protein
MNSVEDLDVFKLAHELALKIYSATENSPGKKPTAQEIRLGEPRVQSVCILWKAP